MTVPPTGLRIGAAYVGKPLHQQGLDADRIQAALLEKRTARPPSLVARALAPIVRWL